MRSGYLVLGAILLASACMDTPLEPPPAGMPDDELEPAAALAATTCTKSWASGIGGLWADPTRWTPNGVPGPNDVVCIDAVGTYDIRATQQIDVRSLVIGGDSVGVTFDFDPPIAGIGILTDDMIAVMPGSELNVLSRGLAPLRGALLANFGTIDIENVCACGGDVAILEFDRIDNIKRLELDAPMSVETPLWTNGAVGVIVTSGQGVIDALTSATTIRNWGRIVGSTQIHASGFDWRSGTVGEISPATSTVFLVGGPVDLSRAATGISGRLEMDTDSQAFVLDGSVPRQVHLEIFARGNDIVRMTTPTSGSAVLVDGFLTISTVGQNVLEFDELVIDGQLTVNNIGSLELRGDELVNEGNIKTWISALTFPTAGGTFTNGGTIQSFRPVTLTMGPATTFLADGGSTESDFRLVLDDATLLGRGTIGSVISLGGSIEPTATSGFLSVDTLGLDGQSELVIPVTQTGHGLIEARAEVTFAGTLRLRPIPSRLGGSCGDVVTAVRHRGLTPIGAFASFVGLNPGLNSNWRVASLPDSLVLAGYDLNRDVTVSVKDSLAAEGSGTASVMVCLGPTAPTADVVVAATPVTGQLVAPSPATFDQTNWMIPMTFHAAAVDDAIIEPPQFDTLTYALTSADPRYDTSLTDRTNVIVLDDDGSTDFELVLQNAPDTVAAGAVFEVVYRATNDGPTLSTGSAIILGAHGTGTITFQQGFGATCIEDPAFGLGCGIDGMDPGEQRVIALVFQATAAGDVALPTRLFTQQPDPDQGNNQLDLQVIVN